MLIARSPKAGPSTTPVAKSPVRRAPASSSRPHVNPLWHQLSTHVKPRLDVSAPGDAFEREADRVATQVLRMPEPIAGRRIVSQQAHRPMVQRTCQSCDEETVQRKAVDANAPAAPISVSSVSGAGVIRGGGQPLSASTRAYFEPRFGADFRNVRVHTDAKAGVSARALNALAYTMGDDIVFGHGQFLPESARGRHLLAHELTHVIQQGAAVQFRSPGAFPLMRTRDASSNAIHVNELAGGPLIQRVDDPCNKHYSYNCDRFKCYWGEREAWCNWNPYRVLGKKCHCPLLSAGDSDASALGMAGAAVGSIAGALGGATLGMLGGLPGAAYGASEGMEMGADVGGQAGMLVEEGLDWLFGD
jgi:hypothetical protein